LIIVAAELGGADRSVTCALYGAACAHGHQAHQKEPAPWSCRIQLTPDTRQGDTDLPGPPLKEPATEWGRPKRCVPGRAGEATRLGPAPHCRSPLPSGASRRNVSQVVAGEATRLGPTPRRTMR